MGGETRVLENSPAGPETFSRQGEPEQEGEQEHADGQTAKAPRSWGLQMREAEYALSRAWKGPPLKSLLSSL